MAYDFFLNSGRGSADTDREQNVGVSLVSSGKILPNTSFSEKYDVDDVYNSERDLCRSCRFIINVEPICGNPLFNMITEVVDGEGTDQCRLANYQPLKPFPKNINTRDISARQAVMDTEYTHPEFGNLSYNCGLDIFNNHMLRARDFEAVNPPRSTDMEGRDVFNTINDFRRNSKGGNVLETVHYLRNGQMLSKKVKAHMYHLDDVKSFQESVSDGLVSVNGWYGFYNPSWLEVESGNGSFVNRLINNRPGCEHIDLYPGKKELSFLPGINRARNRIEKNWDYVLTYPFSNNVLKFNEINGNDYNGISVEEYRESTSHNGSRIVLFRTKLRHNLKRGDKVALYADYGTGYSITVPSVAGVGNIEADSEDAAHYFSVYFNEIAHLIEEDGVEIPGVRFFVKRTVAGYPCEYYFRMFKAIKKADGSDFESTADKIALSETIYGDRNVQIVYTDDVSLDGLRDNRNRELSEVYITFIKRNAGYKEWYYDKNTSDPRIEISHCFGKVTSGLELSPSSTDYNVHKLHNIDPSVDEGTAYLFKDFIKPAGTGVNGLPIPLEDGITLESDVFYGDIVEYSPVEDKETVIEKVYHRFNTAQRELSVGDNAFKDLVVDRIYSDDYDLSEPTAAVAAAVAEPFITPEIDDETEELPEEDSDISGGAVGGTTMNFEGFKGASDIINTLITIKKPHLVNLAPEGYFYAPHYRIEIRKIDDSVHMSPGTTINSDFSPEKASIEDLGDGKYRLLCRSPKNYGFVIGDKFMLYDTRRVQDKWCVLESVRNEVDIVLGFEGELDGGISGGRYVLVYTGGVVPDCASYLSRTTQQFVWRDVLMLSETSSEEKIFNTPFSNGRLYYSETFPFFLRRQDPFGIYGLRYPNEGKIINNIEKFIPKGEQKEISRDTYVYSGGEYGCY